MTFRFVLTTLNSLQNDLRRHHKTFCGFYIICFAIFEISDVK